MTLDQFQLPDGKVKAQIKYDQKVPQFYFVQKYAGGPESHMTERKPIDIRIMVKAAVKI